MPKKEVFYLKVAVNVKNLIIYNLLKRRLSHGENPFKERKSHKQKSPPTTDTRRKTVTMHKYTRKNFLEIGQYYNEFYWGHDYETNLSVVNHERRFIQLKSCKSWMAK